MLPTKLIVARNLANLRKREQLTQVELAEKFNYTDKSVSKWEHGETMPDIEILKQLADFYGVTLDYLVTEHELKGNKERVKRPTKDYQTNGWVVVLLSITAVWLAAVVIFFIGVVTEKQSWPGGSWMIFLWAVPASAIVGTIYNTIWGGHTGWRTFLVIFFIWTSLACTYVQLGLVIERGWSLWEIFLIGIPLSVVAALWDRIIIKKPSTKD